MMINWEKRAEKYYGKELFDRVYRGSPFYTQPQLE